MIRKYTEIYWIFISEYGQMLGLLTGVKPVEFKGAICIQQINLRMKLSLYIIKFYKFL